MGSILSQGSAMNREKLLNRLHNWKFDSASNYLDGEPDDIILVVKELSKRYRDIGWVTGESEIKNEIDKLCQQVPGYKAPQLFGLSI